MKIGSSAVHPGSIQGLHAPNGVHSFRHVLGRKVEALTSGWREIVRAEPRYSTAPVLEAPPRPASVDDDAVATRRSEFRSLLDSKPEARGEAMTALLRLVEQRIESEELMLARASQGRR